MVLSAAAPGDTGAAWRAHEPGGDLAELIDAYAGRGSTAGKTPMSAGTHGVEPRTSVTTREYGIVDNRGDGVLFRRPGETGVEWTRPEGVDAGEEEELGLMTQGYDEVRTGEQPELRLSGDRTLAIDNHAYGQQVFATPEALARSSADGQRTAPMTVPLGGTPQRPELPDTPAVRSFVSALARTGLWNERQGLP